MNLMIPCLTCHRYITLAQLALCWYGICCRRLYLPQPAAS